jgi:hypothetical protein
MLLWLGLIVGLLLITWYEVPSLLHDRLFGELAAFAALMLLALILSSLQIFGVNIPNPLEGLRKANMVILSLVGAS